MTGELAQLELQGDLRRTLLLVLLITSSNSCRLRPRYSCSSSKSSTF